jgi:hypothetical protein
MLAEAIAFTVRGKAMQSLLDVAMYTTLDGTMTRHWVK